MTVPLPVRILTVCTGNICRSPVAERLLQAGFDRLLPGSFEVRSAGTRAMVGAPIQPLSASIVESLGGTPDRFAARQLTAGILSTTDIVLTMATGHRAEVLQLDPSVLRKTFTIREFARLLGALEERDGAGPVDAGSMPGSGMANDTAERWRDLPARLASVRHLALATAAADNDVVDPYRRGAEVYALMEDQLAPAILKILRHARLDSDC